MGLLAESWPIASSNPIGAEPQLVQGHFVGVILIKGFPPLDFRDGITDFFFFGGLFLFHVKACLFDLVPCIPEIFSSGCGWIKAA